MLHIAFLSRMPGHVENGFIQPILMLLPRACLIRLRLENDPGAGSDPPMYAAFRRVKKDILDHFILDHNLRT